MLNSFFSCFDVFIYDFPSFRLLSLLIWSVAVERSVRVNGVSLVFPNMSLLRAMVDCHSLVTYPRRLRLCMRYASSRLLFDFSTPFRLQSNKFLVIFGETLVVKKFKLHWCNQLVFQSVLPKNQIWMDWFHCQQSQVFLLSGLARCYHKQL